MTDNKRTDCVDCKYENLSPDRTPCLHCCNNYENQWTKKIIKKEFTQDELLKAFEDKYVGRRVVGIEEIPVIIRELFK